MITIINLLIIYLIGVILAENQLLKQNLDKSEHKYKWFSWATFWIILLGNLTTPPNKQNITIHNPMAYNITIHNIL